MENELKEKIVLNESQNDGGTVHLYYNEMVGAYTAYGLSAFYVSHVVEPSYSYSDEMNMPLVIVNKRQVLELRQTLVKEEHRKMEYYRFRTRIPIGEKGYKTWTNEVKRKAHAI